MSDENDENDEKNEKNENGGVILTAAQLADITSGVTTALLDAQTAKDAAAEAATLAAKEAAKPSTPTSDQPFNMDEMAKRVVALVKEGRVEEQSKVFETLWADKFNTTMNDVPGLENYLNGEDDYARVRMETLNNIPEYDDKMKALNQLTKSYKQALAGTNGRKPVVNTKMDKQVKKNEKAFKDINDKWMSGEYNNSQSFAEDFFGAMSNERAGLH